MKNVLVVGDLHCKMSLALPCVLDAAIANCCDTVIFTGDLCDDWGVDGEAVPVRLFDDWDEAVGVFCEGDKL